jgi:ADP-ribose pyrophosphatase YjhB (NUDIX family)
MKIKIYCNYCKGNLADREIEGRVRQVCEKCGQIYYENPLPVATIVIVNNDRELLLIKRKNEPFKGMWCLPIGFAETGESIEEAALRELKEEAGIEGEIVQLLDVDSLENPFYGDLLVSTFEGRKKGGEEKPGDDAIEVKYFPITNLPKLAFDSQNMALKKFIAIHEEEWAIKNSMKEFVLKTKEEKQFAGDLISDELLEFIESHSEEIISLWLEDVCSHPSAPTYHAFDRAKLSVRASFVLNDFSLWLRGKKPVRELESFYVKLGEERKKEGFRLSEVISSFFLFKKHIWMFVLSKGFWERPLDIYRVLEMDKRITSFFDFAVYYTTIGFDSGSI